MKGGCRIWVQRLRYSVSGQINRSDERGFSLIELIISMVITLIILGGAVAIYSGALQTRERESGRVDAITAAQAALSVMSREIGNSGYGIEDENGLVLADSGAKSIRFRANVDNVGKAINANGTVTAQAGEDVMYFYDSTSQSVVRFDRNTGLTSGIINRVSDVDFLYQDFNIDGTANAATATPNANTAKVIITLSVILPDVAGQPPNRVEQVTSAVALRNSPYILGQY